MASSRMAYSQRHWDWRFVGEYNDEVESDQGLGLLRLMTLQSVLCFRIGSEDFLSTVTSVSTSAV